MSVYVSEHAAVQAGRFRQTLIGPPLATYSLSSASTAATPQAGAQFVMVSADAGSLFNYMSQSSGLTLSSTNAVRIPTGVVLQFAISTSNRLQAAST
jgi:hypothetical protein